MTTQTFFLTGDIRHAGVIKVEATSLDEALDKADDGDFEVFDEQHKGLAFDFAGHAEDADGNDLDDLLWTDREPVPSSVEAGRTFSSYVDARKAGFWVEHVGRPLDPSKGAYVSADGLTPPVYLTEEDQDGCVYGCGEAHTPDTDECGTGDCHGRPGDDRPTPADSVAL